MLWRAIVASLVWTVAVHAQTVTTIQDTGDSSRRLDFVIVGDGYTSAELGTFASDVTRFLTGVFAQDPFKEYKNYFNVRRIDVASAESGVDHPERSVMKNTAFDAAYNCGSIQRLICVSTTKVLNAVSVLPPSQRDLILVIVNDSEYGGSGGSVAVASTNVSAVELILHETGHTLAFLADEYTSQPPACSDTVEPPDANATKQTNRTAIKWNAWIDASTPIPTTSTTNGVPGLYVGAAYCPTTLYRPTYDSKMRSLGRPYEQINTEQFVRRFYEFVTPIESKSPTPATLSLPQGYVQTFSITTPQPATHQVAVTWTLNGQSVGAGTSYSLSTASLPPGSYTVSVTAADTTPMVRNDPQSLLMQQATWSITVTPGATLSYTLPSGGGSSLTTRAESPDIYAGHASLQTSGSAQSGLAIFRYKPATVTVTEAAVPASPRISAGRIYAEIGSSVNTGVAISNPDSSDATITFYFTDAGGNNTPSRTVVIPARGQISRFLSEGPFDGPAGLVGTFTFTASVPVAAIALRGLSNERTDFLLTTLPVLDLGAASSSAPVVFSHFASGGGWTTTILLVNPSDQTLDGTLIFPAAPTLSYSIAPRSSQRLSTASDGDLQSGSVRLVPVAGQAAPTGLLVFSYRLNGITVSEAGVPTVAANSTFLLYAEASGAFGQPGSVQPGVALANASSSSVVATLQVRNLQGQLLGTGSVTVPGGGQISLFLNQIQALAGIPLPYEGLLRVSVPTGNLTMVGLLGRYNERGDFLITTTPPFPENQTTASELVFPHFVDGGGYETKFILLNGQSQQVSGGVLVFRSQTGAPIIPPLR